MNKVFVTSTEEYQPISHGDSYLYENYLRITTFLKNRIDESSVNRVAKPNLISGNVEWYCKFSAPMLQITNYDEGHQQLVESEYVQFLAKIDRFIKELESTGDEDKVQWARLLSVTFSPEDNILISNGKEWAIIWGWKFLNKLKFISPVFTDIQSNSEGSELELEMYETVQEAVQESPNESKEPEEIEHDEGKEIVNSPQQRQLKNVGFFQKIIRFFRYLSYRFWGLMLLIILILIVLCICKKCCSNKSRCSELVGIENKINDIEKRVEERCKNDTITFVK